MNKYVFAFLLIFHALIHSGMCSLDFTADPFERASMFALASGRLLLDKQIDPDTAEMYLSDYEAEKRTFLENFAGSKDKIRMLSNILSYNEDRLLLYKGISGRLVEMCSMTEAADNTILQLSRCIHDKITQMSENKIDTIKKNFALICIESSSSDAADKPSYNITNKSNGDIVLDVNFDILSKKIVKSGNDTFVKLNIKGCGQLSALGKPELPAFRAFVAIPEGCTIQVQFFGTSERWIDLKHPVYPVQIPPLDTTRIKLPFKWDRNFYQNTERYPEQKVTNPRIVKMKKYKLALLSISPVLYLPKTNQLITYRHMQLTVKLVPVPGFRGSGSTRTHDSTPITEEIHDDASPSYQAEPGIIPSIVINPGEFAEQADSLLEEISSTPPIRKIFGNQRPDGADYLIIAPEKFKNALQPFAEWKTQKGFITNIVTTESIAPDLTPPKLMGYLKGIFTKWKLKPSYILFVGDTDVIPVCENREPIYGDIFGNIPNDYEYSLLEGDDPFPDVFIGRFPADSASELEDMIKKSIDYELKPSANQDYYKNILFSAVKEEGRIFHETQIFLADYAAKAGYAPQRIFSWDGGTNDRLIENMNKGCFLACFRGHGEPHGWLEPEFVVSDIDRLTSNQPTLFLSTTCLSNKFNENDPDCFGEKLLKKKTNGAAIFLGATMPSYSFYNDDLLIDMIKSYENFKGSIADLMLHGLTAMAKKYGIEDDQVIDQFHFYNILGDPSIMPWSARPTEISVNCPEELDKSQKKSINITVRGNGSVKDLVVAAKGEGFYVVSKTSKEGVCKIDLEDGCLDKVKELIITVTGKNIIPVIKVVSIK